MQEPRTAAPWRLGAVWPDVPTHSAQFLRTSRRFDSEGQAKDRGNGFPSTKDRENAEQLRRLTPPGSAVCSPVGIPLSTGWSTVSVFGSLPPPRRPARPTAVVDGDADERAGPRRATCAACGGSHGIRPTSPRSCGRMRTPASAPPATSTSSPSRATRRRSGLSFAGALAPTSGCAVEAGPDVLQDRSSSSARSPDLSYQRVPPGYRSPYSHTHKKQEGMYVPARERADRAQRRDPRAQRVGRSARPAGTRRGCESGPRA